MTTEVHFPGKVSFVYEFTNKLKIFGEYLTFLSKKEDFLESFTPSQKLIARKSTFFRRTCTGIIVKSLIFVKDFQDGSHGVIQVEEGGNATMTRFSSSTSETGLVPVGSLSKYFLAVFLEINSVSAPHKTIGMSSKDSYRCLLSRWRHHVKIMVNGKKWRSGEVSLPPVEDSW